MSVYAKEAWSCGISKGFEDVVPVQTRAASSAQERVVDFGILTTPAAGSATYSRSTPSARAPRLCVQDFRAPYMCVGLGMGESWGRLRVGEDWVLTRRW